MKTTATECHGVETDDAVDFRRRGDPLRVRVTASRRSPMLAARSPPRPAAFLQPVAGRGPGAAARPSPTDRRRSPAAAPPVAGRSLPFDWSLPARGGSPPAAGRSPPLSRPPRAGRHLSSRGRHRGAGLSPAVANGSPAGPAGAPPLAAGSPTQLGASSLKTTATVSLGTQRRRSVWRFW